MYIGSRIEEIEVITIEEKATITLEISETLLRDMLYHAEHPNICYCKRASTGQKAGTSRRAIRLFLKDAWESYSEDRPTP